MAGVHSGSTIRRVTAGQRHIHRQQAVHERWCACQHSVRDRCLSWPSAAGARGRHWRHARPGPHDVHARGWVRACQRLLAVHSSSTKGFGGFICPNPPNALAILPIRSWSRTRGQTGSTWPRESENRTNPAPGRTWVRAASLDARSDGSTPRLWVSRKRAEGACCGMPAYPSHGRSCPGVRRSGRGCSRSPNNRRAAVPPWILARARG